MTPQNSATSFGSINEEDLNDYDGIPEDSWQAWFGLLLIGLTAIACGTMLYGIIWVVE